MLRRIHRYHQNYTAILDSSELENVLEGSCCFVVHMPFLEGIFKSMFVRRCGSASLLYGLWSFEVATIIQDDDSYCSESCTLIIHLPSLLSPYSGGCISSGTLELTALLVGRLTCFLQ